MIIALLVGTLAFAAVIGSRVWALRRVREAQERDERPFNYEDKPTNPYTGK